MLRTCLVVGSALALLSAGCGDDGGSGNDDAAVNQADAPVGGPDGAVGAIDAPVNAPDGALASCTPQNGTNVTRALIGNFVNPVLATAPQGDPRLFIVERAGRIRIYKDGATLPTPFLDIRGAVETGQNEQGLLGLAFHPQFSTNGRFFVYYSEDGPGSGRPSIIAEYNASPGSDVATPTETRILTLAQPNWNHNGGMLAFGPDGYLYISFGDGGGSNDTYNNGQDTNTLLATMLRIDINSGSPYSVPASNPFVGGAGMDEIWAYGLRNPWRFSFDSQTGDLYIGDVGQGQREEINVQPASSTGGENYGWPDCEGTRNNGGSGCGTAGFTAPVLDKTRAQGWISVIGGYVYRGTCMPDLQGWYFYGDYAASQNMYRFQYSGGSAMNDTNITSQLSISSLSAFGQDGLGELYMVSHSGPVYKIVHAP